MPIERLNNADVIRELNGHWESVLMAVMRKYDLKEVKIVPDDMEFMVPPYKDNGGQMPHLAAIGLRDTEEKGGFILVLCKNRDEAINRMRDFQIEHPQSKPKHE